MEEFENEMARLREELRQKDEEIREKDKNLDLAGKFGKELLETNSNLSEQLETLTRETNRKTEVIKQENYSLKSKLETRAQMERCYNDEIENLKIALKQEKQKHEDFINTEHQSEISDFKKQIRNLQGDMEKEHLVEKHLNEKIGELESLLAAAHEQLEQTKAKMNETCSDELAQLYSENSSLQNDNMSLANELSDSKKMLERLQHDIKKSGSDLDAKDAEIEEKQCLATSYFNALQKSREKVQELKVELDMIQMEHQDQKKKGNSLFSEVEDRRVEAEKVLISKNIELDTVKKQLQLSKENYHKLKMQMAGLLQMSCSRADTHAVQNLQSQLNQARSENTSLMVRLNVAEQQVKVKTDEVHELMSKMARGSNLDYADYLKALIAMKEAEIEKLTEEVKMGRLQKLSEQDRLIHSEGKRYTLERTCEKLQGQNLKLSVKVEELQMKYEPDKCKKAKERITRIEKIPGTETGSSASKEEEKENMLTATEVTSEKSGSLLAKNVVQANDNQNINVSSAPHTRLISGSYYKPLKIGQSKKTSSKVTFCDEVNTNEISANDSNTSASDMYVGHEQMDEPTKDSGHVRGRERHNKVIQVKKPSEAESDQCKTQ